MVRVEGRLVHLGCFASKRKAIQARIKAEEKYFGEYRRDI